MLDRVTALLLTANFATALTAGLPVDYFQEETFWTQGTSTVVNVLPGSSGYPFTDITGSQTS